MMTRLATLFCALVLGWIGPMAAGSAAELRIGITQFPSTLNPLIDSMLAKSYVLAMTRRPLTAYDQDWQLICMLCNELPTIENGLAVPETLADGKQGIAVTYQIHPEARWGDGEPVTSADMVFTWEGRPPSQDRGQRHRILPAHPFGGCTRRQDRHAAPRPHHLPTTPPWAWTSCPRTSSGRSSRPTRRPTADALPSTPSRPTRASLSDPTRWSSWSPAPTSSWRATRPGGAPSRPSTGSRCG